MLIIKWYLMKFIKFNKIKWKSMNFMPIQCFFAFLWFCAHLQLPCCLTSLALLLQKRVSCFGPLCKVRHLQRNAQKYSLRTASSQHSLLIRWQHRLTAQTRTQLTNSWTTTHLLWRERGHQQRAPRKCSPLSQVTLLRLAHMCRWWRHCMPRRLASAVRLVVVSRPLRAISSVWHTCRLKRVRWRRR